MPEVICLHNYQPGHDKFYACRIDCLSVAEVPPVYRVVASWGPIGRPKAQAEQIKGEFSNLGVARTRMVELVQEKRSKGYVNVEDALYAGGWSKASILTKIDMTRCFDPHAAAPAAAPQPAPAGPSKPKAKAKGKSEPAATEAGRSRRVITF